MEDIGKILKIQNKISKLLSNNNGVTCHFFLRPDKLDLVTYNPTRNDYFLLHSVPNNGLILVHLLYEQMLSHVEDLMNVIDEKDELPANSMNTYTVTWNGNDGVEHKSYFYGDDIEEVMKKFYYGKTQFKNNYNVLEIKQNPSS